MLTATTIVFPGIFALRMGLLPSVGYLELVCVGLFATARSS